MAQSICDGIRQKIVHGVSVFLAAWLGAAPGGVGAELLKPGQNPIEGVPEQYLVRKDGLVHFGDMIFRDQGTLGAIGGGRWPGGALVYRFDATVSDATKQAAFRAACDAWTVDTPITCRAWSGERNYVLVVEHQGDGCGPRSAFVSCSWVGMVGKEQKLHVYRSHWSSANVLTHEVGHALGFVHEHQRSDRDSFVKILDGNIEPGLGGQFALVEYSSATDYDYDSIMHYDNCAFARGTCNQTTFGTQTIWPVGCLRDKVGGATISALDREALRKAYAPRLTSLFPQERDASCGSISYSKDHIAVLCGASCAHASALTYIREEIPYDKTCGTPFPRNKGRGMCASLRKEYLTEWTDRDTCSCGVCATRNEIWAKCACSRQTLNSKCGLYYKRPSEVALSKLASGKGSRERAFGSVVGRLWKLKDKGAITDGAVAAATLVGIAGYRVDGFPWRYQNMIFNMERDVGRGREKAEGLVIDEKAVQGYAHCEGLTKGNK